MMLSKGGVMEPFGRLDLYVSGFMLFSIVVLDLISVLAVVSKFGLKVLFCEILLVV